MHVKNQHRPDGRHVYGDMVGGDLDGEEVYRATRHDNDTGEDIEAWVGLSGWVSVEDCDD
jgi:hypothetical protein